MSRMSNDSSSYLTKITNMLKAHNETGKGSTSVKGRSGEDRATSYLQKKGYRVIDRNYRWHGNEIDIIAKDKGWLVFIEVKSSSAKDFEHPLLWISEWKQRNIIRASTGYIVSHGLMEASIRFDVIAIDPDGKINHVMDAFRP